MTEIFLSTGVPGFYNPGLEPGDWGNIRAEGEGP